RYMILRWLNSLLPKKWREKYDRILFAIDKSLGNYIRGQLLLSITVALVTYAIYQILGLKFALLLAIFMGLMNVIPYFGPIIGSFFLFFLCGCFCFIFYFHFFFFLFFLFLNIMYLFNYYCVF